MREIILQKHHKATSEMREHSFLALESEILEIGGGHLHVSFLRLSLFIRLLLC